MKVSQVIAGLTLLGLGLALALAYPGIGHPIGVGLVWANEYCTACGVFRQGRYAVLFGRSFAVDGVIKNDGGLRFLHDQFLPGCTMHEWETFHTSRGSLPLRRARMAPRPTLSLEIFRMTRGTDVEGFVKAHPVLARQVVERLFPYARTGADQQLIDALMPALLLGDASETAALLTAMGPAAP